MIKMENKRGWLRIVEAGLAILIIFGVMLVLYENMQTKVTETDLYKMIPPLLDEISKNNTLRENIINNDTNVMEGLNAFLAARIKQPNIKYDVRVCEPNDVCGLSDYPTQIVGNIYASERIISSTLTAYAPKKVKIFLWRTR